MVIAAGDRILEVGVGTGINASLYPSHCHVTGIDLSTSMLDKARERVARQGLRNIRLLEMDAAHLTFADNSFDIVYAPYLVSVVPDPVQVVKDFLPLVHHMHLKDYNGGEHFIGYCPLGQGNVDIAGILNLMEGVKPEGMMMVELDSGRNPPMEPGKTAEIAKEYLQKLGYSFRT